MRGKVDEGVGAGEGCDVAACCCGDSGGDARSSVVCATVDVVCCMV